MAIKASFSPTAGALSVFGAPHDDTIVLSRDAAGSIFVNGGAVPINGGAPTVANTRTIQAFGQGGDDTISIDETNGAMPAALLFGGAGKDVLTGGSVADQLFGGSGNDTLLGKGGDDLLFGGGGYDVLTGGTGTDQVFGQAGDDRMIWNPGDGSDLLEGGAGIDTAEVNGGNGVEIFTITANGTRVRFDRVEPAPFFLDIGTTENLVLNANGGDDIITAGNGLATLIQLTLDGGAGNDRITGGDGNDRLIGGDGNDLVNGGRGNDTAHLGAGDDTFVWNPGDGSDTVEGEAGFDTLVFNGANIAEQITLSANGPRALFTRDVATITMDLNGVERILFNALGGTDNILVNDLSGTGIAQVEIDLAAVAGGTTGDGQLDTVTVNGTAVADRIALSAVNGVVTVNGLPELVNVEQPDATDALVVKGGDGNDAILASTVPAGTMALTLDGGAGDDTIVGSQGADTLIGGDGNDFVVGGGGNDAASLGAGDDTFVWNPGDASDTVDGQAGLDTLQFNGANIGELFDIAANVGHARLTRDIGAVTMDLNKLEHIRVAALDGADTIQVGDLTGTGVTQVAIDLASALGGTAGDVQIDSIIVNAAGGSDHINISATGTMVTVDGLSAQVTIDHADASDRLTINGLAGDDAIDASGLAANRMSLALNGGTGNDVITGSHGDDTVNGGTGNDAAFLGDGDDLFVWNPGDASDIVEGQAGADTLLFNGANVNEKIDVTGNGERASLTRDIGTVTMDLNGTETIDIKALGGADTITVSDLSGTDVSSVNIDLATQPGGTAGDNLVDTIVINATIGDDAITVTNDNGVVTVSGLAAEVTISGFEATDRIVINGLAGDDVITAAGLGTAMQFTAGGDDGDDILIGSDGNDTLFGSNGDDILLGGVGQDVLDGGPGDNILIQGLTAFASLHANDYLLA